MARTAAVYEGAKRNDTICFRLLQSFRQADKHCLHSTPLGHNVRKLDIPYDTFLQDLHSVINNVPLVEELVIGIDALTDKDIERIALNCPQLKCLFLTFPLDGSDRLFDPLRHCTNLRELSIYHNLGSQVQLAPLQHCRLEKLRLTFHGFDNGYTRNTSFGGIPTLTHLDMHYMTGDYLLYRITLPSGTLFPVLTDLRIVNCQFQDKDAMVPFFQAHPLIRTLSLGNMQIHPAIMDSLATDLVHLQRLSLISNGLIPPSTKAFHRLEKLTLQGSVMKTQHMAMCFPNLHYIHVSIHVCTSPQDFDFLPVLGVIIGAPTRLKYLSFTSYDSVPGDLKVHLPRRMGGQLEKQDLDHIRETAIGLVWVDPF